MENPVEAKFCFLITGSLWPHWSLNMPPKKVWEQGGGGGGGNIQREKADSTHAKPVCGSGSFISSFYVRLQDD